MTRGDQWWADFGTPFGSDAGFRRPVLIVQDEANAHDEPGIGRSPGKCVPDRPSQEKSNKYRDGTMLTHFSFYTPDPIRTGDLLLRRRPFYLYWRLGVRMRERSGAGRPFLHIRHIACGKVV
jgi:hypothetical protein